jgi:hypothetical protein
VAVEHNTPAFLFDVEAFFRAFQYAFSVMTGDQADTELAPADLELVWSRVNPSGNVEQARRDGKVVFLDNDFPSFG